MQWPIPSTAVPIAGSPAGSPPSSEITCVNRNEGEPERRVEPDARLDLHRPQARLIMPTLSGSMAMIRAWLDCKLIHLAGTPCPFPVAKQSQQCADPFTDWLKVRSLGCLGGQGTNPYPPPRQCPTELWANCSRPCEPVQGHPLQRVPQPPRPDLR